MTYHANHSWCNNSNWNNESFDSEVMVYFGKRITKTDIMESYSKNKMENLNKIKNPDFINLTETKKVFNQKEYDWMKKLIIESAEKYEVTEEKINKELEKEKDSYYEDIYVLKQEVIDWLNENVKDYDVEDINNRKGWCIGNDEYIKQAGDITIFFKRELDAFKFIRKWSIFKEPVFYFDYFSDDRRNMDLNKIIHILNTYLNIEINTEEIIIGNDFQGNINLNPLTFRILDWEKEDDDDDISLDIEETKCFLKSLYENEDVEYKTNNLTEYKEIFKLRTTDKISLGYEEE